MKFLKSAAIAPLLLASYPILALLANNITQMDASLALRPWLISLGLTLLLFWLLKHLLRDSHKAALLLSLGLILFFSYGHVYQYLETTQPFGLMLGRHRYLAPLWLLLLTLGAWWILKKCHEPATITSALNISAAFLMVFPLLRLTNFFFSYASAQKTSPEVAQSSNLSPADPEHLPDVYLLILDMYGRQDALQLNYDIDNAAFLEELEGLGFYVADCSLSNYNHTELSLASELNYDYIENLIEVDPRSTDHSLLWPLIQHSSVRQQLEALGYQTVAFETGYPWSQIEDAGLYFQPPSRSTALAQIQPFEAMLVNTTAIFLLTDSQALFTQQVSQGANYLHYNRASFLLNKLEELPGLSQPKFIFAHVLVPHQPYVFTPDGALQTDSDFYSRGWGLPVDNQHDYDGYRNQIAFINQRILAVLHTIISQSDTPPIILLQSDHGISPYRNANLGAYYLPGGGASSLYSHFTSVNTFRVVFNTYFGGQYALLPDMAYESASLEMLYDLTPYTESQPACAP